MKIMTALVFVHPIIFLTSLDFVKSKEIVLMSINLRYVYLSLRQMILFEFVAFDFTGGRKEKKS
jgi:hypothetical protein